MLRWVVEFMEKHREELAEIDEIRKLEEEQEEKEWKRLSNSEKENILKVEKIHNQMSREEKLELAKRKRAGWRE